MVVVSVAHAVTCILWLCAVSLSPIQLPDCFDYQTKWVLSCQRPFKTPISFLLSCWNPSSLSHTHCLSLCLSLPPLHILGPILDPSIFPAPPLPVCVCSDLVHGCVDFSFVRQLLFLSSRRKSICWPVAMQRFLHPELIPEVQMWKAGDKFFQGYFLLYKS